MHAYARRTSRSLMLANLQTSHAEGLIRENSNPSANQINEFLKERSLRRIEKSVTKPLFQDVTDVFTLSWVRCSE